ncbi:MAG: AAA family ATPase [Thioalkalispiraceae bacterium]|jgi:putative secretion ATPase (PEP-CTERM system associated)
MYLEYFKLKDFPFRITPDADYLYMSAAHSRAIKYMEYAILNKEGFVLITGDIGCGKTTIIKKIINSLDDEVIVAKIFQTQLNEIELLQAILSEFGYDKYSSNKVELLNEINQFLINSYIEGKQVILIIDDAQNLSKRVLEEVKLLSCVETDKDKLLQVILVGQPELNDKLESKDMEQLLQRISLRFHVKKLTHDETVEYIKHRLSVAGADSEKLFDKNVYNEIYEYTRGTPRLINTLCDTSLTCAFAESKSKVTLHDIESAVTELNWAKEDVNTNKHNVLEGLSELSKESLYHDQSHKDVLNHLSETSLNRTLVDISWQLTRIADIFEQNGEYISSSALKPVKENHK